MNPPRLVGRLNEEFLPYLGRIQRLLVGCKNPCAVSKILVEGLRHESGIGPPLKTTSTAKLQAALTAGAAEAWGEGSTGCLQRTRRLGPQDQVLR